jgi:hypothetical protein
MLLDLLLFSWPSIFSILFFPPCFSLFQTETFGRTLEATTRVAAQTMSVDFAICGNLQAPCQYTQGSSPRCASPNTAAACQSWGSSRQKDQACLGNFNGTVGAIPIIEGNEVKGVTLTYYGGDICSTCTGVFDRYTFINIYCDKTVAGRPSNIQYGVIQPPSSKSTITFSHSAGCMTYSGGGLSPGSALLIMYVINVQIIAACIAYRVVLVSSFCSSFI